MIYIFDECMFCFFLYIISVFKLMRWLQEATVSENGFGESSFDFFS